MKMRPLFAKAFASERSTHRHFLSLSQRRGSCVIAIKWSSIHLYQPICVRRCSSITLPYSFNPFVHNEKATSEHTTP